MKKLFFFLIFLALPFMAQAQTLKFGYFSYNEAIKAMPDYAIVQKNMADLKSKYEAETKRSEDEFNRKYEEFLDGQRDFAPTILQKRQAELQDMMEKNVAFKKEAQRLLVQAETDAYAPLKAKVKTALQKIGHDKGLSFILNTDNDCTPYIDPAAGEDINAVVKDALK